MQLTDYQEHKAREYRLRFPEKVAALESEYGNFDFPPHEDDADHPESWRGDSWRWFRKNYDE